MEEVEVKIKTLTPLWTGDVDRKCSRVRETGIIGSLRWWYEALVRGLDDYACDPTSDDQSYVHRRCPKEQNNKRKYCFACLVFGATGMRRSFRLHVSGGKPLFDGTIQIRPKGRNRGWYLGGGITGDISLNIIPFSNDFDESLVLTPLFIASNWGAIGARVQHGYGVVEITKDCQELDLNSFKKAVEKITYKERLSKLDVNIRHDSSDGLPNIKEMFFAKVVFEAENEWWKDVNGIAPRFQDNYRGHINDPRMIKWISSGSVPIAPAIKNWLRYGRGRRLWKTKIIESWLFGTIRDGKVASKINVSCAYSVNDNLWEFRIWGWIPKSRLPTESKREEFLNNLKQTLNGKSSAAILWTDLLGGQTKEHKLKVWREFNSPRDDIMPNESNIDNYIQNLLKNEAG